MPWFQERPGAPLTRTPPKDWFVRGWTKIPDDERNPEQSIWHGKPWGEEPQLGDWYPDHEHFKSEQVEDEKSNA